MDTEPITSFLNHLRIERGYSAHTLAAYDRDLQQFYTHLTHQGLFVWGDLDARVLEGFFTWLAEQPYKPASVSRKLAAVRSFLHFLFREGWIAHDLASLVHQPKLGQRLPKALSEEDVRRLLAAARQAGDTPIALRDTALLEVLYATGLRVSELVALNMNDFTPSNAILRCVSKGNKERELLLHDTAALALLRYLHDGRVFLQRSTEETALFLNRNGRRLTRQGVWTILRQYARQVGLEALTPHTLRHTFATHLLNGGAALRDVQHFLGHASITSTQIYTHVSNRHKRDVYDRAHPRAHYPQSTEE